MIKTMTRKRSHPHIDFLRAKRRLTTKAMMKPWRVLIGVGLSLASVGVVYLGILMAGFYGLKYHITDVPGAVDPRSEEYTKLAKSLFNVPLEQLHLPAVDSRDDTTKKRIAVQDACQVKVIQATYPKNGEKIQGALTAGANHAIIAKMIFAVRLHDTNAEFRAALDNCIEDPKSIPSSTLTKHENNIFPWAESEEWGIAKEAFRKDAGILTTASTVTGVEGRMIVSAGFVEQMRLYFTEREFYEKFFRPLKVLGNATQFAWGVMAIKEATAIDVERHLQDPNSPYYLGADREHALDFSTPDQAKERFTRLTDEKNHLFSYLYGGFELAQYRAQWRRANFPIDDRPEILATLYNIGFSKSKPNDHPQVGGSTIRIADIDYSFGALAFEFYYSGEMLDVFPYSVASS